MKNHVKFVAGLTLLFATALLLPQLSTCFASEDSNDTEVNLSVPTVLSLAASMDHIEIVADAGIFNSGSVDINAGTNNLTGYTLMMSSATENNALNMSNGTATDSIPSITSDLTSDSFPATGGWGYSLDATTYSPIPVPSNIGTLAETDEPGSDDYTLTFGAKPSADNTAGVYNNTVKLSIVANDPPEPTPTCPTSMKTMQSIDSAYINNMATNTQEQMCDTRDEKTYTVAKLADGNVWMTKNLALGDNTASENINLDSSNSDLPSSTTFTIAPTDVQTSGTGSWECSSDSACQTKHIYATGNNSYGNYYSWYTATANTGTYSMSSSDASGSICPKGWRLPTGGSSGEFMTLMTKYGWSDYYLDPAIFTDLPLSFVFSSYYDSGVLTQGNRGYWWSSTVEVSGTTTYSLIGSSGGNVYPHSSGNKYFGFSVRCVAAP